MKVYVVRDDDGMIGVRETLGDARRTAGDVIAGGIEGADIDIEEWDTENEEWCYATVAARYLGGEWLHFVDGKGWVPESVEADDEAQEERP